MKKCHITNPSGWSYTFCGLKVADVIEFTGDTAISHRQHLDGKDCPVPYDNADAWCQDCINKSLDLALDIDIAMGRL